MFRFAGHQPIRSRFYIDLITLITISFCSNCPLDRKDGSTTFRHGAALILPIMITILTDGWRLRWTITFPLLPVALLQFLRLLRCNYFFLDPDQYFDWFAKITSFTLILTSAAASILFPAVELRPMDGPYNVAVIDMHLPWKRKLGEADHVSSPHLVTRVAYPTNNFSNRGSSVFYYLPQTFAKQFCDLFVRVGAPWPVNKLTFLVQHWRLIRVHRVISNAPPIDEIAKKMPIVVFSHGLSGNAITYSHQIFNLASHGYCVIAVDHTDGSALHVTLHDGSTIPYNQSLLHLNTDKNTVDYVRARREQTSHRVDEVIALSTAFMDLIKNGNYDNEESSRQLSQFLSSKIDTGRKVILVGHSFGGATAMAAAALHPELFECVVALDPAIDWMPDYGRWAWLGQTCKEYRGGTGGYIHDYEMSKQDDTIKDMCPIETKQNIMSVHELPSLFLYSEEWSERGWGGFPFIQTLHRQGKLGPVRMQVVGGIENQQRSISDVSIIHGTSHMAFSDLCMLIPTWMARGLGLTGRRNPLDSAEDISTRIIHFLKNLK